MGKVGRPLNTQIVPFCNVFKPGGRPARRFQFLFRLRNEESGERR